MDNKKTQLHLYYQTFPMLVFMIFFQLQVKWTNNWQNIWSHKAILNAALWLGAGRGISCVLRSVKPEMEGSFFNLIGSILKNYLKSRLPSSEEISSRASERKNSSLLIHTYVSIEREAFVKRVSFYQNPFKDFCSIFPLVLLHFTKQWPALRGL